ncbi:MAG: hypothetical protein LC113_08075 [Acidobacteria bacterium]|nr:hypothetical protein [Acidobacteriota bacterium]
MTSLIFLTALLAAKAKDAWEQYVAEVPSFYYEMLKTRTKNPLAAG